MVLEISDEVLHSLRVPPQEQVSRLRQELGLRLYAQELLTFGKARELAQMTKWEFHILLGKEGIVRHYDDDDLADDLNTLEILG
jgi:predicted HTH domain antitoxin